MQPDMNFCVASLGCWSGLGDALSLRPSLAARASLNVGVAEEVIYDLMPACCTWQGNKPTQEKKHWQEIELSPLKLSDASQRHKMSCPLQQKQLSDISEMSPAVGTIRSSTFKQQVLLGLLT